MKKVLTILTALTLSLLPAAGSLKTSAAGAWDGKTADIGFYAADPAAAEFVIETPEEYAGLCEIAFIKNAGAASGIKGDGKLYYDTDGMVVTDPANADESRCVNGTDFMGKTIRLGKNIDLASKPIKPLGYPKCFYGILDGNGKTIKNVNTGSFCSATMYNNDRYVYGGLIYVANAVTVVKNLTVENIVLDMKADQAVATGQKRIFAGGIIGYVAGSCITVENVKVNGLTVNLNSTDNATQQIYWGVISGINGSLGKNSDGSPRPGSVYKNIDISFYAFNNPANYGFITSADSTDDSDSEEWFGLEQSKSKTTYENITVKNGTYTQTKPGENETPATADALSVICSIGAASLAAVFASRKKRG